MIRLVVLAAVVLVARPADASCGFTIGQPKPFCPQRGSGYQAPIYRYDLGVVADRLVLSGGDSTIPAGTYATRGGLFRTTAGFFGFYLGGEASFGVFDVPPIAARRESESDPTTADGWFGSVLMLGGYRQAAGPFTFGLEVAGGARSTWRSGAMMTDDSCEECELRGVLDLRANLGVFWTPFVSTSVQVGASLLRRDEYTAALMLGFSVFPFDGLR